MRFVLFSTILACFSSTILIGQNSILLDSVKASFERNQYRDVISISDTALNKAYSIANEEMIYIYLLRSVSHFALGHRDSSKINYIEILKLNKDFEPDPILISPKIIKFFKTIKADFYQIINENSGTLNNNSADEDINLSIAENNITSSIIKNMVLPGWGHFSSPGKAKAIIITTISTGLLASSVYYIIRTEDLHDKYLHESNPDFIPAKYDEYNQSFKTRNILLISYAVVWLYSILDVWLFSSDDFIHFNVTNSNDSYGSHLSEGIQFKLSLSF